MQIVYLSIDLRWIAQELLQTCQLSVQLLEAKVLSLPEECLVDSVPLPTSSPVKQTVLTFETLGEVR